MHIIPKPITLSTPQKHYLSSSNAILTSPLPLLPSLSSLSLSPKRRPPSTVIRMGGGPRTYPGGVSKWQWKRMQAKKSKQLLKARLARERQIYEMRKRAELKAAFSELERPWELVRNAAPKSSTLFSVTADDQLKVLADRFQKPGGFDMWTENDGPQIFVTPDEGLPTARFFSKGVVHSVRPYGRLDQGDVRYLSGGESSDLEDSNSESRTSIKTRKNQNRRVNTREDRGMKLLESDDQHSTVSTSKSYYNGGDNSQRRGKNQSGAVTKLDGDQKRLGSGDGNGRMFKNTRQRGQAREAGGMDFKVRRDGSMWPSRQNFGRARDLHSEDVYDMSLQGDGNYGFVGSDQDDR